MVNNTNNITISLKDFIRSLSRALDFLTLRTSKHHQRVTLIALKLAEELHINDQEKLILFYAGLLHDFGIISTKDKLNIINFDYTNSHTHTETAWQLLSKNRYFEEVAKIIRYHHDRWLGPNESGSLKDKIHILSQILYLSDRIEVLISDNEYILKQRDLIINRIAKFVGMWFNPRLGECFKKLSLKEVFWLDLSAEFTSDILDEISPLDDRTVSLDDIIEISNLFSQVIDFKSRYTKTHCKGVTELSVKLGERLEWSSEALKCLHIAALLHDLGKFSIPDEILEKPTVLNPDEYTVIKKHPYYTYHILKSIKGFEDISQWAAFHHEKLDGKGYPFGLSDKQIPQGARIIAVADMFTALNEDRPYRRKLPEEQVLNILNQSATQGAIDPKVLEVLKSIIST